MKDAAGLDLARFGPEFECYRIFLTGSIRSSWRFWIRKPSGCVSGEGLRGNAGLRDGSLCAAVAAVENGWIRGRSVTVRLAGGELKICWDRQSGSVFMTGPAATVFEGEIKF